MNSWHNRIKRFNQYLGFRDLVKSLLAPKGRLSTPSLDFSIDLRASSGKRDIFLLIDTKLLIHECFNLVHLTISRLFGVLFPSMSLALLSQIIPTLQHFSLSCSCSRVLHNSYSHRRINNRITSKLILIFSNKKSKITWNKSATEVASIQTN